MPINLRPLSSTPFNVEEEQYDQLVRKTSGGWSNCETETEWLAKLHYLRQGQAAGKLETEQFTDREARLVTGWLRKMT